MRRIAFLIIFSMTLLNLLPNGIQKPSETPHVYLVKLWNPPILGGHISSAGAFEWNQICIENSPNQWHLNNLLADNDAHFEDLFPDTIDAELDRWIIVTSKKDIASALQSDMQDIEVVEDGAILFSIDRYAQRVIRPHSAVDNDKTWGIRLPKIQEGLNVLKPTREILVGVVDTGCDLKHPALQDKLVQGRNFAGGDVDDPSNRATYELHATHVTGTIVARKCPNDGFFGIANGVAKVMPIRVLDQGGSGTVVNVSRGVAYAADHGCHVINMSLGSPHYSKALHDAIKYAVNKKGVTVVCAKGNASTDKPFYPAEYSEVIRVTATSLKSDGTEERAPFSNYGKSSTCAAPGHFTFSTLPNSKYGFLSGTSMACPHAAACVAVILSQGKFTPEQIKSIVEARGDELSTDKPIGKRINLLNFIQRARHELMTPAGVREHAYGQCCMDAGIICRITSRVNADGNGSTTIYQDTDTYDAVDIYRSCGRWNSLRLRRDKDGIHFVENTM